MVNERGGPPELPYPVCNECGSENFVLMGLSRYRLPYNARTGQYGLAKTVSGDDYPQAVYCQQCDHEVTGMFQKRNLLEVYGEPPII